MDRCLLLYATQTGKARACSRRTSRILREQTKVEVANDSGSSFDEEIVDLEAFADSIRSMSTSLILFVSTTGDGEHTESIQKTWKQLLRRSLPSNLFAGINFAIYSLGDRAYGPQFCAAGRKLAVRFMQLGATLICKAGYGDENTSNGGVFADLDLWLEKQLMPVFQGAAMMREPRIDLLESSTSTYSVEMSQDESIDYGSEWQEFPFKEHYSTFFERCAPLFRYSYDSSTLRRSIDAPPCSYMTATVKQNIRITASDWKQDTRHLQLEITGLEASLGNASGIVEEKERLPYLAGDVISIMPSNDDSEIDRFMSVLPKGVQTVAGRKLQLHCLPGSHSLGRNFKHWPKTCTLRGLLKFCMDFAALPEQEDLRALAKYCSLSHPQGVDQRDKLISLSESKSSALYTDYVLREKRTWTDVFYDFDSLRHDDSSLDVSALLTLLGPIRPREFSIASAPSEVVKVARPGAITVELCIAVVEGTTRLGRSYRGLCSSYLSSSQPESALRCWIRQGTFVGLPTEPETISTIPVLYIGAGTGIAPLRGLLRERSFLRNEEAYTAQNGHDVLDRLIFGCRKKSKDFYYDKEWTILLENRSFDLVTAFSQDQKFKFYVQQALRKVEEDANFLLNHLIERGGAIYIAGGANMAKAVKDEIVELLSKYPGIEEKAAKALVNEKQRQGLFTIEAWS